MKVFIDSCKLFFLFQWESPKTFRIHARVFFHFIGPLLEMILWENPTFSMFSKPCCHRWQVTMGPSASKSLSTPVFWVLDKILQMFLWNPSMLRLTLGPEKWKWMLNNLQVNFGWISHNSPEISEALRIFNGWKMMKTTSPFFVAKIWNIWVYFK